LCEEFANKLFFTVKRGQTGLKSKELSEKGYNFFLFGVLFHIDEGNFFLESFFV
jgi:hypothetical protein